jgi:hypothetical protein
MERATTLVGYYSPEGHDHDDNCTQHRYECSNGHIVYDREQNVCPNENCDWKGKTDCFCSTLGLMVFEDKNERDVIWRENERKEV